MALTNAFISAVKSNIRRLGSSLSGGSLSDLGAAAQKINAEILNARNRTQAALRNLDEPYARSLAHRNGFDLNSQGQIISPASTVVIPRSGAVSQADIERAQAYHNERLGAEIVERRAAEQAARRSEAAKRGAATRKANREQAAADNHIYNLQAQANAALARQAARYTTVNIPDEALMREAVAGEVAREQNKKAFVSGVRDRQRAAVAAGQNARIDAHLAEEASGWEQLGENSRNLNAVRGRQQAAAEKAAAIGQKQADSLRLHQVTNDARANHRAEIADSEAVAEQSKRIAENNAQIELYNARKLAAQPQARLLQHYRDKASAAMKIANVSPVTGEEAEKLAAKAEEFANRERIQASGDTFDYTNNMAIEETQKIREQIEPIQIANEMGVDLNTEEGRTIVQNVQQRIEDNRNAARTIGFTNMYNSAKEEDLRNFARQNIASQVKKDQEFLAANPLREGQDIESMKAGYDNIMSTIQKIREGEITWNPGDFKDFDLKELTSQIKNDKAVIDASDRLQNAATVKRKLGIEDVGSGKTLQETAAVSAQDQAVASAASDFSGAFPSFEKAMSGDGNVSLDRAILRSKMGGDPSDWGFEGGSNHLLTNQEKGFNKFIKDLRKSNASPEEKQKLFNDKVFEIQKNIAEGPGMSDFFFGNQLHTGAIGAAAIMGTMGVAFGGRKSNAELYSSPF